MLILPVSLFLEGLWNSAKLGMGVRHDLLCLLVQASKEKNYIYLNIVKFALALLSWNFKSVSFVGKRKIKLTPRKWNKDDSDWSLKNWEEEKLTGLTVCHIRFRETAGRCFSSYLHIKTSSQVFQIIQQIDATLFNWSLIISAAGAYQLKGLKVCPLILVTYIEAVCSEDLALEDMTGKNIFFNPTY